MFAECRECGYGKHFSNATHSDERRLQAYCPKCEEHETFTVMSTV